MKLFNLPTLVLKVGVEGRSQGRGRGMSLKFFFFLSAKWFQTVRPGELRAISSLPEDKARMSKMTKMMKVMSFIQKAAGVAVPRRAAPRCPYWPRVPRGSLSSSSSHSKFWPVIW